MDAQDLIIWGRAIPDRCWDELERIKLLCEWGMRFGVDGFVRMEMHLYVLRFTVKC